MIVSPIQALKGRLLLISGWLSRPGVVPRSKSEINALSREVRGLSLYYHHLSPKCIKTRRLIQQLNLPLEIRDIRKCQVHRDDLLSGIGELAVPCLKILDDGEETWIQDINNIRAYLVENYGSQSLDYIS